MNKLLRNSVVALALCACSACRNDMVYYSYQHVGSGGWGRGDTLSFIVELRDSLRPLSTEAEVRFDGSYPYRELTLTATHNLRDTARFETDTIRISMTDEHGTRRGSNWSFMYQADGRMKVLRVVHPGSYTVKLAHVEADSLIKGVCDVGFRMTDLEATLSAGVDAQKDKQQNGKSPQ